jgi:tetratricopeptide (TPR) repeat protein
MAEEEFAFPFDLAHLSILRYEHLGPDIGATEARNVSEALRTRLEAVLDRDEPDSPVFVFLPDLTPSTEQGMRGTATARSSAAASLSGSSIAELRASIDEATREMRKDTPSDWLRVVDRLEKLRALQPDDPYVVQQLALATYKSRHPDVVAALRAARETLTVLEPRVSSDGETVGLWGAIHKRLWEAEQERSDLDEAIRAHERGFYLRNDHYNGINLAFLLNVRASQSTGNEAIADRVLAARMRREVLKIADEFLNEEEARAKKARDAGEAAADGAPSWDEYRYWVRASRVEALFGLGHRTEADQAFQAAKAMQPPPKDWMIASTEEQLDKLKALLSTT